MDPAERQRLRLRWNQIIAEQEGLEDLPTGDVDPAERQRQLDQEMEEIEYELGMAELEESRVEFEYRVVEEGKKVTVFCAKDGYEVSVTFSSGRSGEDPPIESLQRAALSAWQASRSLIRKGLL